MSRKVNTSLGIGCFLLSLVAFNLTMAQNEPAVRFFVEGNPSITVNGTVPTMPLPLSVAEAVELNPGDELCYPKAQDTAERVWLVYANGDRMPLEARLESCFTVPKTTFWSVLVSILSLYSNNAEVVNGRGEARGDEGNNVNILLPADLPLTHVTLWVRGGPGPFVLRLTGAETQLIHPDEVRQGTVRDEVAFVLPVQVLQPEDRVEVLKGDGSLFYCGKVVISSEVTVSTADLLEGARALSVKNAWQSTPVIYSYVTAALASGQVAAEVQGEIEAISEEMRSFMMKFYSVNSCD